MVGAFMHPLKDKQQITSHIVSMVASYALVASMQSQMLDGKHAWCNMVTKYDGRGDMC